MRYQIQGPKQMPKDFEDLPKEPARNKATRKWRNHDLEKRIKEEKAKPTPPEPKELEVGDVIQNDKIIQGRVVRAQTRFAKDLMAMLETHTLRNSLLYEVSRRHLRKRLLFEKLKRLQARQAQQNQGGSNV
jgi:hypothetical protein